MWSINSVRCAAADPTAMKSNDEEAEADHDEDEELPVISADDDNPYYPRQATMTTTTMRILKGELKGRARLNL